MYTSRCPSEFTIFLLHLIAEANRSRTKRRRDSGTLKGMGQDMNEYVTVLEECVGAVVIEDWLPTSTDGMYLMSRH